jgi:DNA-binding response OmpR family regulator
MTTIVMVEDDANIALAFGVRLKSMGYTVHIARDAIGAVATVRKTKPDVVLLDISLPGGDGFVVAERLQRLDASATTPIIFITASKQPGLRDRAMKCGAVGFLEKPFDAAQLAAAIESALSPGDDLRPSTAAR